MLVIAFNLCRTAEVAFDQQRAGVAAESHGRDVERRAPGNYVLGLAHVGNDGFERQAYASGHASQRHGRAHHFEEAAARDGIDPFGSAFRELAMQRFLERRAASEFLEAAPVFRAGLLIRLVDLLAQGVEIELALFRWANIFSLRLAVLMFDLHWFHTRLETVILGGARLREAKSPLRMTSLHSPFSSMTRVATGNVFHTAYGVLFHQHQAQICLVGETLTIHDHWIRGRGLLILHVEDLIARAQIILRRTVAVQTPLHLQRGLLVHEWHLVNRAVAAVAADAFIDMNAVIEENEVGKLIHPRPLQGLARAVAGADGFQQLGVGPDL